MHDIGHKNHEHDHLLKRIEHWIKHNDEHKKAYLEWAERAMQMNLQEVSDALRKIARLTDEQNDLFRKALKCL